MLTTIYTIYTYMTFLAFEKSTTNYERKISVNPIAYTLVNPTKQKQSTL